MTPAYCQPINFIKVYKFAIFLAQDQNRSAFGAARGKGGYSLSQKRVSPFKSPERKVYIASEQLEELQCLPIALP